MTRFPQCLAPPWSAGASVGLPKDSLRRALRVGGIAVQGDQLAQFTQSLRD
jgi:hypothetical protein